MAVAFLNKNTVTFSSTSPTSTAMTVSAGTNVVAFALIAYDNSAGMSVSSISYGGRAMTSAGTAANNATSHAYAEIWYLVAPPASGNLVITMSGTVTDMYFNMVAFQNVNQTTPVRAGTYNTATGTSNNPTITVTSNVLDLTISVADSGGNNSLSASNQTSDGISTGGTNSGGTDHATTAAGSITHTWTGNTSTPWAIAGLSVNGAANGPTITAQPTQQTVNGGDSATFTVTATGTGTVHYQWKKNGSNVGTDSSSYNTGATVNTDTLSIISCSLSDDNGTTPSSSVYLLVNPTGLIW